MTTTTFCTYYSDSPLLNHYSTLWLNVITDFRTTKRTTEQKGGRNLDLICFLL